MTEGGKPRVSIGMPVFNGDSFIRMALESLLAQTFTDFELIISDNASSDSTQPICMQFAHCDIRIRYVRQTENIGAVRNFMYVLGEARGDYFMWAAADDEWAANWVETLLPIAESSQCLAYGLVQTIDDRGAYIHHAANSQRFHYAGPILLRRLKYFSDSSFLGKANPIYGIYPRNLLSAELTNVLTWRVDGADMLFLYNLLSVAAIHGGSETYLYKRIHAGCAAGDSELTGCEKRNLIFRILKQIARLISLQIREVKSYNTLSSTIETLLHFALSPLLLLMNAVQSLLVLFKSRKS